MQKILNLIQENFTSNIEVYFIKTVQALVIIIIGILLSILIYKLVIYLFKKFKIVEFINKFELDFLNKEDKATDKKDDVISQLKFSHKFKIDKIIAKAAAYYIFLVFFRISISVFGIDEVENFLDDLLKYLPSLFIGVVIGYFGFRFANFIHDVVYYTISLKKKQTAKIIATGAKIIVMFFTLMAVLDKIGITSDITTTILNGFIAMLAIAGGLAFGLGGKDVAREILESFKK